jgi:hypothetical protein
LGPLPAVFPSIKEYVIVTVPEETKTPPPHPPWPVLPVMVHDDKVTVPPEM